MQKCDLSNNVKLKKWKIFSENNDIFKLKREIQKKLSILYKNVWRFLLKML